MTLEYGEHMLCRKRQRVLPVEARCWLSEPGSSHPENKTQERTAVISRRHKALEIASKCQ